MTGARASLPHEWAAAGKFHDGALKVRQSNFVIFQFNPLDRRTFGALSVCYLFPTPSLAWLLTDGPSGLQSLTVAIHVRTGLPW